MSVIPIVTESQPHVREEELASLDRDRLVLSAEERRWGRRRVKTANGRELALALPTGTALTPGHVLYVGADYYVVIEAAEEPVLVGVVLAVETSLGRLLEFQKGDGDAIRAVHRDLKCRRGALQFAGFPLAQESRAAGHARVG